MNRKAIDCWRWRKHLTNLYVCLHKDEATAVGGLYKTMHLESQRASCLHFLPPEVGGATAAILGATAAIPNHGVGATTDLSQPAGGATAD